MNTGEIIHAGHVANLVATVTRLKRQPVNELHPSILKSGKDLKKLSIVCDLAELNHLESKFDFIILGNVLCEVPCVRETLAQIDVLLKPGGKVYFSEHVASPVGTWQRRYQDFTNPCWRLFMAGCKQAAI